MKTVTSLQKPIAILLLIISINFSLLAATLGCLCFVLEIQPASVGFIELAGLAALTALWLAYRLGRLDEPVRSELAQIVYGIGIGISLIFAIGAAISFSSSFNTTRWIDLIIISNGLFLMLCLSIKLNDTKYMID